MKINKELSQAIELEMKFSSDTIKKSFNFLTTMISDDYSLELHGYRGNVRNVPWPILLEADALISEKIGSDLTLKRHPHASVLLFLKNETLIGCALFQSHSLIAISSLNPHNGIGALLYNFSLILNNNYLFFKIKNVAVNFYKKMGAEKISKSNWDHRDPFNKALINLANKDLTYFFKKSLPQEPIKSHTIQLDRTRLTYYTKLGIFKEKITLRITPLEESINIKLLS